MMDSESEVPKTNSTPDMNSITSEPKEGQSIIHEGKEYTTVKEGLAYILVPKEAAIPSKTLKLNGGEDKTPQSVFYNPIQQFNRDLSVLAIRAFQEELMALKKKKWEVRGMRRNIVAGKKRKRGDNGDKENLEKNSHGGEVAHNGPSVEAPVAALPMTQAHSEPTGQTADASSKQGEEELGIESKQANDIPTGPAFKPKFRILDALSATGLRALRYAHEIPSVTAITANDLSSSATESIKLNIKHNKLDRLIEPSTANAQAYMYNVDQSLKYDVIDLDPYGTAAPFIDAALQAINDQGLLCITCTDAGVWASAGYPEKTFALYGGLPMKGPHSHEGGLRLILHSIATSAARYGLAIEPLLSLSIDFYARVFVRIRRSPLEVKLLAGKTMIVYNCDQGCGAWSTQLLGRHREMKDKAGGTYYKHSLAQGPTASEKCEHCGFKTHLAGPMYAGPLHSSAFINRILSLVPQVDPATYATLGRLEGMLTTAREEFLSSTSDESEDSQSPNPDNPAAIDPHPFFFIPHTLAKVLHCTTPQEDALRGALRGLGYRVTRSHCRPGSVRTDAPWSTIWQVMREWVRQKAPIKDGSIKEGTPGWQILKGNTEKFDPLSSESNAEAASTIESVERDLATDEGGVSVSNKSNQKPPGKLQVIFNEELGKERTTKRLVRYQINPRANWGPMNRASGQKA